LDQRDKPNYSSQAGKDRSPSHWYRNSFKPYKPCHSSTSLGYYKGFYIHPWWKMCRHAEY